MEIPIAEAPVPMETPSVTMPSVPSPRELDEIEGLENIAAPGDRPATVPVNPPAHLSVLHIKAKGYGQRDLLPFSITKPGFNYGNRKRSSGDGCHKYDHVQLTKKDGTLHIGIINCFDYTPKANAPRKVRVECPNIDKKDSRVSGNTSQLTLIQHRDGYLYNQTKTFHREKRHESSNQEDSTAQLLLFSLS